MPKGVYDRAKAKRRAARVAKRGPGRPKKALRAAATQRGKPGRKPGRLVGRKPGRPAGSSQVPALLKELSAIALGLSVAATKILQRLEAVASVIAPPAVQSRAGAVAAPAEAPAVEEKCAAPAETVEQEPLETLV